MFRGFVHSEFAVTKPLGYRSADHAMSWLNCRAVGLVRRNVRVSVGQD